jgi:hypothetical protein
MSDGVRIKELVLCAISNTPIPVVSADSIGQVLLRRTGTFFCVMTTEVSLPRTAIAVCPEPEIALNAYSGQHRISLL